MPCDDRKHLCDPATERLLEVVLERSTLVLKTTLQALEESVNQDCRLSHYLWNALERRYRMQSRSAIKFKENQVLVSCTGPGID
jgi:hypothetical protein